MAVHAKSSARYFCIPVNSAKIHQEVGTHEDLTIDRKETQTAVVWTCLPFISCGQTHLARHRERGKKIRQTEEKWEDNGKKWTGLEFAES